MSNEELDQMLKAAPVPEREARYWARFPQQVMSQIQARGLRERAAPGAARVWARADTGCWRGWATHLERLCPKPAWVLALAVVCLGLGFVFGQWKARHGLGDEPQLAVVRKCYGELEALFPHQIRAIVFDAHGARLELAEQADVPASPPLYLRVWGPSGCQEFVTFSGQQIRLNGQSCEVLLDRSGAVLVIGEQLVWSSSEPGGKKGAYRLEARPLYKTS